MGLLIRASFAIVLGSACASIRTQETIVDLPIGPTLRDEVVADSIAYKADATVEGERVVLSVDQSETCAAITTPRVHRTRTLTRTADSHVVTTTWTLAALGLGAGIYGLANADALAANDESAGQSSRDYRTYGAGMIALGLGAAIIGIVDAVRAADSAYDDGVIVGSSSRTESACRHRSTRDEPIVLALRAGETIKGRLDDTGTVAFSLTETPEGGVPDATTELAAVIGHDRVHVNLSAEQREHLREALVADPHSRLSADRLARHRDECSQTVAAARALTPLEPTEPSDDLHLTWATARSTCAELWTPELEGELAALVRRIETAHCNQRLVRVASSLTGETAETSLEDAAMELAELRASCTSETQLAQIHQLETRRAAVAKHVAQARVAEARLVAQQQAREARDAQRRQLDAARARQSWGNAMLLCNDGTLSPSCTCGRGSYRGCCSWHGGVNRCSAGDPD